jgi:hypothetical protein
MQLADLTTQVYSAFDRLEGQRHSFMSPLLRKYAALQVRALLCYC